MNSLAARLLAAALLVLLVFVGLTGLSLEHAFHTRALQAEQDKLKGLVYGLLGASDLAAHKGLTVNENELPDAKLERPDSGLYALVLGSDGRVVWRSPSLLGTLPGAPRPAVGQWRFQRVQGKVGPLFMLDFGIRWADADQSPRRYTYVVASGTHDFDAQLSQFRLPLWLWLSGSSAALLLVQWLVLRWGLRPLRRLAGEMARIEAEGQERVEATYPRELRPLIDNLNALLRNERNQKSRYRQALADLAHSLKTPLAVMRGLAGDRSVPREPRGRLSEQVTRMNQIVDYQLARAATAGRRALTRPLAPRAVAERLGRALAKAYAGRDLRFEVRIASELRLRIDEGDLTELLGNLMDNAAKWGRRRVRVSASMARGELTLEVEDDGPGFPRDAERLLERGARADSRLEGQGIGLAMAADIVHACDGRLRLGHSPELGGACVTVTLPAV